MKRKERPGYDVKPSLFFRRRHTGKSHTGSNLGMRLDSLSMRSKVTIGTKGALATRLVPPTEHLTHGTDAHTWRTLTVLI